MIIFNENPNGYLLIALWIIGFILGIIGKNMKESGWVMNLAMWLNIGTVILYVLWVYIVGLIWHSP
jgi:hypothetical protein